MPERSELKLIQNQIDMLSKVLDKLDNAIDRLDLVSSEVKQVVAVHESKLQSQETINDQFMEQITRLHDRISIAKDAGENDIKELQEKVSQLDRWRYLVVGGGMVVGFIFASIMSGLMHYFNLN